MIADSLITKDLFVQTPQAHQQARLLIGMPYLAKIASNGINLDDIQKIINAQEWLILL